jgi:hypothetical protein
MKRFWLVLLSLGLVMAFSASAFAVDVKFSGEFYFAGMYLDKTTFQKDTATTGPNTAFCFQRLRLRTDFVISPGLTLVTRMDMMERAWGAARTAPGTAAGSNSQATTAENENIAVDYAYVQYASPIGLFAVGYMTNGAWATPFGNSEAPIAKMSYLIPIGNFTMILQWAKGVDLSTTAKNPISATNTGFSYADQDVFYWMGIYSFKQGTAGLGLFYVNNATSRPALGDPSQYLLVEPYISGQFGPVKVQAELDWVTGKAATGVGIKQDIDSWNGWIDATATFGPIYFGGTFAYVMGDNPTTSKLEGGFFTGGTDFNPCLILFNYDRAYWAGNIAGFGGTTNGAGLSNAWFYQGRFGVKPTDKWDFMASVSYANADQKPAGFVSDAYGWEFDVTGTYKITNNLSYMLGFGYLATGDYFKGATVGTSLNNDYLVINKLTLTF